MEPETSPIPLYLRSWWRVPVDMLLIGFVGYQLMVLALPYLAPGSSSDYYETLPDMVEMLDEKIITYLDTTDPIAYASTDVSSDVSQLMYRSDTTPLSGAEFYESTLDSVVYVNAYDGYGYFIGSGVVLTESGLIATNYHVIDGAEKIAVTYSDETTTHVVSVVAQDQAQDIVILQVAQPYGTPASLRPANDVLQVGEVTYNIGHPENLLNTFTAGVITGIRDYTNSGLGTQIQISNPISAGSSGGPLFDEAGRLIGLTTWSVEYDANYVQVQSLNFALPITAVTDLLIE